MEPAVASHRRYEWREGGGGRGSRDRRYRGQGKVKCCTLQNGRRGRGSSPGCLMVHLLWAVALLACAVHGDGECQLLAEHGASSSEVAQCLLEQTALRPSDPKAWLAVASHFHAEGNTADARTAYHNVILIAPNSQYAAEAHLHTGVIHHSNGDLDEALEAYEKSVSLKPSSPNTMLNMAIILHTKGRYEDAIDSCRRAVDEDPSYFAAYANMGILQQQSGDIEGAVETYEKAISLKPDFAAAYFNLGTAHEHRGDLSQAITAYQTAIQLQEPPQGANPKFHSRLALALVEAGHLERDMVQQFDNSRHCRPIGSRCKHDHTSLGVMSRDLDPSFFVNVGMVYLDAYLNFQPLELLLLWSSSMFEEALDRADGVYHIAQHGMGLTRELMGRPGEAAELYRMALSHRPESGVYRRAVDRASAKERSGSTAVNLEAVRDDPAPYAHVDDSVETMTDRYGCGSHLLTPLRVLNRITRSTPQAMSRLAVHVNPFPPLRKMPPQEDVVSDSVSEIYIKAGLAGVILSNSAPDLQPYRGVILAENVTMVLSDSSGVPAATHRMIHKYLAPLKTSDATLDYLRLDNVTCTCQTMDLILSGSEMHPPLVPKLVVVQINPSIPPPVRSNICRQSGDRFEGAWGCSLAEASAIMERHGYALVQLDYADAMFVLTSYNSVVQSLPPNAFTAHQIGYSLRPERLRCSGIYRGTLNHPEGDAWSRHADSERTRREYESYARDPYSYIRGNPGRGSSNDGAAAATDATHIN